MIWFYIRIALTCKKHVCFVAFEQPLWHGGLSAHRCFCQSQEWTNFQTGWIPIGPFLKSSWVAKWWIMCHWCIAQRAKIVSLSYFRSSNLSTNAPLLKNTSSNSHQRRFCKQFNCKYFTWNWTSVVFGTISNNLYQGCLEVPSCLWNESGWPWRGQPNCEVWTFSGMKRFLPLTDCGSVCVCVHVGGWGEAEAVSAENLLIALWNLCSCINVYKRGEHLVGIENGPQLPSSTSEQRLIVGQEHKHTLSL